MRNLTAGLIALVATVALLPACTLQAGGAKDGVANGTPASAKPPQPVSAKPPEPVESASLKKPGSSLYFLDTKTGWVVTNGNVYTTTDAGTSWTKVNQNALSDCDKAVFANQQTGWLLCDHWTTKRRSNSVLATKDGGRSWQEVLEIPSPIFDLSFLSDKLGYVSSRWQPLNKTIDGGKTWTQLDGIEGLNYVYFLDEKRAWGYGGAIWRTDDGGENWRQTLSYDQPDNLWHASFVDFATGWIMGNHELWRTTDGEKWIAVEGIGKQNGDLADLDFVSAKEGWIATSNGSILHSVDGGATWEVQTKLPIAAAQLRFVTNLNGWVLDTNGELMRTDDGGKTWKPVSL
jgi:photosystem II stability/assembly factor-like uncharacterized protein